MGSAATTASPRPSGYYHWCPAEGFSVDRHGVLSSQSPALGFPSPSPTAPEGKTWFASSGPPRSHLQGDLGPPWARPAPSTASPPRIPSLWPGHSARQRGAPHKAHTATAASPPCGLETRVSAMSPGSGPGRGRIKSELRSSSDLPCPTPVHSGPVAWGMGSWVGTLGGRAGCAGSRQNPSGDGKPELSTWDGCEVSDQRTPRSPCPRVPDTNLQFSEPVHFLQIRTREASGLL